MKKLNSVRSWCVFMVRRETQNYPLVLFIIVFRLDLFFVKSSSSCICLSFVIIVVDLIIWWCLCWVCKCRNCRSARYKNVPNIFAVADKLYLILRILLYLLKVGLVCCLQYMFIKCGFALLHFFLPLCQQLELYVDKLTRWYEEREQAVQNTCRSWPLCSKSSSCILPIHSCLVWVRPHVPAGKFSKTT